MKSRRSVFLVPANKRAVRRLIAQRGDPSGTSWIYIGRDIRFFRWLEDMEYLNTLTLPTIRRILHSATVRTISTM